MARRHQSLIPLSRDHYEGLLLAHQVREPDRQIMADWPHDHQGSYVVRFYREHLVPHFLAEEESLFPLAVRCIPDGKTLIDGLLAEHRRIEQLMAEFNRVGEVVDDQALKQFGDLLEAHIRKEERQLFPAVEQHAAPDLLAAAGREILQHYSHP